LTSPEKLSLFLAVRAAWDLCWLDNSSLTAEVLAIVNRFLPAPGGIGTRSAYGYESESALSPSVLTALGDAAARENYEMRPRATAEE
jgi:hypothetical protein